VHDAGRKSADMAEIGYCRSGNLIPLFVGVALLVKVQQMCLFKDMDALVHGCS